MKSKRNHIPVNTLPSGTGVAILIAEILLDGVPDNDAVERSHRDGGYSFILQKEGTTHMEIDFREHIITAPSLTFIHPNQVHRVIGFERAEVSSWIITTDHLNPELIRLLDDLAPAEPLKLTAEEAVVLSEAALLVVKLSERKQEKLHQLILKESCNALVALVVSQYLSREKSNDRYSRFEVITKAFKTLLEELFTTIKSPKEYAARLNISTSYLNECVKNTTGYAVSHHIQQRIVLEAKRLLYHSDKSVKEVAATLGYDDYSYFTRLFVKVAGLTPIAFCHKNHG